MKHLNKNALCVIDIKTSGSRPHYHDIIEMCIMLVGPGFQPDKRILPFNIFVQPKRPENMDLNTLNLQERIAVRQNMPITIDPWNGQELFERWFTKLIPYYPEEASDAPKTIIIDFEFFRPSS